MKSINVTCQKSILACSIMAALSGFSVMVDAQSSDETQVAQSNDLEVIEVRGIRASQLKSLNDKRFASTVSDSINATDIGKLPDVTIADSLQRITGIQINRSGGEGTSVNIRGIQQVGTTLNGEQMLSASSITSVQPNFADIPATMVSGLDVYKSREANMLSQGMSGLINLRTYRPFQLEDGVTLNAKAELTDGSMGDKTDELVSAFIGYNNQSSFGATISFTVSEKNLADYLVGSTGDDWGFASTEVNNFAAPNVDVNGNGTLDDVYYAFQGHQAGNQFITRDRTGVNGAFQWQVTDNLELIGEVFYTRLEELRAQAAFVASMAWQNETGWFTPSANGFVAHENLIKDENGIPVVQPGALNSFVAGEIQARRTMAHSEADAIEREAVNTNVELKFDNGDRLTGSIRWVHGEARDDNALSVVDAYMNSGSQVFATYNGPGGVPLSDVNPWGYDGVPARLPDGTEVSDYTMIPFGISYGNKSQNWILPTQLNIDGTVINEVFGSNIDRYSATSTNLTGSQRDAELDVVRIDGTYAYELGPIVSVDGGLRYAQREVEQQAWIGGVARTNQFGDPFLSRWKDSASQAPTTLESFIEPISFTSLVEKGYITQITDFQGVTGLQSIYAVDPYAMANPLAWHEDVYGTNIQSPDGANSYDLEETVSEAYIQANLDGDIGDMTYRGNIGLRYVKTELDINQSDVASDGFATYNGVTYILPSALGMLPPAAASINTTREYSDLLPSVNLVLNVSQDQIVRFSFGETVTPHNTNDLAGGITVNRILACNLQEPDGTSIFCATGANQQGNPRLEPWRSTNIDLSYEWYFSPTGIFSVAAFYIDIESFITNTTIQLPLPDSDGVVRGYDPVTGEFDGLVETNTRGNGVGGSVEGIEFGYQQGFDFLPDFWKHFGINANYTYSPSESGQTDYYGSATPMFDNSKHQANLAIWYEDDNLQFRIAGNYRSKTFQSMRYVGAYELARYLEPTFYLDASVSYEVNDNLTISLNGSNLTEETRRQYFQWEDMVDKIFFNERRITLGVQYRM